MVRPCGAGRIEVLLGHPGGPYWSRKDEGAWTIPKGLINDAEEPLQAARREFTEETGFMAEGPFHSLGELRQKSGKSVAIWAFLGDCDPSRLQSNLYEVEWPPRTGRMKSFPEIDRAGWFTLEEARKKILPGQAGFLDRLAGLFES